MNYKYTDFHHGQRFSAEIKKGIKGDLEKCEGLVRIEKNGDILLETEKNMYFILHKDEDYIDGSYFFIAKYMITNLILYPLSILDVQAGDIIYSALELRYRKVLARISDVVLVSHGWDKEYLQEEIEDCKNTANGWYHIKQLESRGYKIVSENETESPVLELTIEQIAEKFGVDVKKVKIKD